MFQKIIYDSIEVFERERMIPPSIIVVGRALEKRLMKEVHIDAIELLAICGMKVEVDEEIDGLAFSMY